MTDLVVVAVAGDVTEAEEIESMLHAAGIGCEIEPAVERHPSSLESGPLRVLVAARDLEAAQEAIEALSDPDDLLGEE